MWAISKYPDDTARAILGSGMWWDGSVLWNRRANYLSKKLDKLERLILDLVDCVKDDERVRALMITHPHKTLYYEISLQCLLAGSIENTASLI